MSAAREKGKTAGFPVGQTSRAVLVSLSEWSPLVDAAIQRQAAVALEGGDVVVLPDIAFALTERERGYFRSDASRSLYAEAA